MKMFVILAAIVFVALLLVSCGPTGPRTPEIKQFLIRPLNTCVTSPSVITGQYDTDGDTVTITVADPSGRIVGNFEHLPGSSNSAFLFDTRSAGVTVGTYVVKLVAKFNSGASSDRTHVVNVVDRNGVFYGVAMNFSCGSATCEGISFDTSIDEGIMDTGVTITAAQLASYGVSAPTTGRMLSFKLNNARGQMDLCRGYDQCGRLPAPVLPVPSEWVQNPFGQYHAQGVIDAINKDTYCNFEVDLKLACK